MDQKVLLGVLAAKTENLMEDPEGYDESMLMKTQVERPIGRGFAGPVPRESLRHMTHIDVNVVKMNIG